MKGGAILAIAIIIIAVIIIAGASQIDFSGGPGLNVYSGRLKLNLIQVKRIDGSAYTLSNSEMRVIHGLDYNDKVGTLSGDSITGDVKDADGGVWNLIADYGTNTTCWIDAEETAKNPYVRRIYGWDGDKDGFEEDVLELYFGDLGPLVAGEDKKEVDVNIALCPARVSSISYVSLTNTSSITTTAYGYVTVTGYMSGFSEGDLAKLAKIQIVFNETGNNTYPDTGYWKLTHLKLGSYTFTAGSFGSYDLANTRYQVMFGDQINHQEGKAFYKAKNAGDLWASYEMKAYCKYPAAGQIWASLKFYFYQPDGTITAAVERLVTFAGS